VKTGQPLDKNLPILIHKVNENYENYGRHVAFRGAHFSEKGDKQKGDRLLLHPFIKSYLSPFSKAFNFTYQEEPST
jgi:hypothetical protein